MRTGHRAGVVVCCPIQKRSSLSPVQGMLWLLVVCGLWAVGYRILSLTPMLEVYLLPAGNFMDFRSGPYVESLWCFDSETGVGSVKTLWNDVHAGSMNMLWSDT